jgi:hypothetical protein
MLARVLRLLGVAAAALAVVVTSGCGVSLHATHVGLIVNNDGISFERPGDVALVTGGETVIRIRNESDRKVRLVLLHTDLSPDTLPKAARDPDARPASPLLVAATSDLKARKSTFATGGVGYEIKTGSVHVYLQRGTSYLLYDVDSPPDAPRFLRLAPS